MKKQITILKQIIALQERMIINLETHFEALEDKAENEQFDLRYKPLEKKNDLIYENIEELEKQMKD